MAPLLPWLRAVGVTGSTAYGEPEAGDDIDFFLITRTGALWATVGWALLSFRLRGRPTVDGAPVVPCFNYVMDDTQAPVEFASSRGFLFAREALTTQVLVGEPYLRRLLGSAPWMGEELPRLYGRRRLPPDHRGSRSAPWGVRILNAATYPFLAAYFQAVALLRNRRLRARGKADDVFEMQTELHRLAYTSVRFDRFKALYSGSTAPAGGSAPIGRDPYGAAGGPRPIERGTPALQRQEM